MSSSFARQENVGPEGLTRDSPPCPLWPRPAARPATPQQVLTATALAVRDRTVEGMLATEERYRRSDAKRL